MSIETRAGLRCSVAQKKQEGRRSVRPRRFLQHASLRPNAVVRVEVGERGRNAIMKRSGIDLFTLRPIPQNSYLCLKAVKLP